MEVREDEHLPVNRREPRERGGHVEVLRERARRVRLSWFEERFAVDSPDTRLAAPDQVRRPVAGDAVHPRGEASPRGVEASRVLPHRSKDVLNQFLSRPPVSQVTHPRPVDQPGVAIVESREGAFVPGCHPSHKNFVFYTIHPEPSPTAGENGHSGLTPHRADDIPSVPVIRRETFGASRYQPSHTEIYTTGRAYRISVFAMGIAVKIREGRYAQVASDTAETKLRDVAQRPARGSLGNFLGDLRDLLRYETLKATIKEFMRDDALGLGAQLAFYLILAIFPFILFCVAILDAFSSASPQFAAELFDYLRRLLPAQVFDLIRTYTENTLRNEDTAPGLLSVGILDGLGRLGSLCGPHERPQPCLRRAGDASVLEGQGHRHPHDAGPLGAHTDRSTAPGRRPLHRKDARRGTYSGRRVHVRLEHSALAAALLFMITTVALLFYFAPDANQPFRWITPGGVVGILLWVLASVAFNLYLSSDFNTTRSTAR